MPLNHKGSYLYSWRKKTEWVPADQDSPENWQVNAFVTAIGVHLWSYSVTSVSVDYISFIVQYEWISAMCVCCCCEQIFHQLQCWLSYIVAHHQRSLPLQLVKYWSAVWSGRRDLLGRLAVITTLIVWCVICFASLSDALVYTVVSQSLSSLGVEKGFLPVKNFSSNSRRRDVSWLVMIVETWPVAYLFSTAVFQISLVSQFLFGLLPLLILEEDLWHRILPARYHSCHTSNSVKALKNLTCMCCNGQWEKSAVFNFEIIFLHLECSRMIV